MNAPLMRQVLHKRAEMRGRCAPVSAMRPTEARNARRPRIGAETRCALFRGAYLCLLVGSQRQSLCVTMFSNREWDDVILRKADFEVEKDSNWWV
jgi:hypothetical protein